MDVAPELGGEAARCDRCRGEFIIPIQDAERLLDWARAVPWERLEEGIRTKIGRGHDPRTIRRLIRLFEKRREEEIWRLERERNGKVLSQRERIWQASERRFERQQQHRKTLEDLHEMDPTAFERLVADLFVAQGYEAKAVGGTDDQGIDVRIWKNDGELWAVAQCKRYHLGNPIRSRDIREFAGAYLLSGAAMGFYFTTGKFTSDAKEVAKQYPWLVIFDHRRLIKHIQGIQALEEIERRYPLIDEESG